VTAHYPSIQSREIRAIPVRGMPDVQPGSSIPGLVLNALSAAKSPLLEGDILIIKHKIISKSERRIIRLDSVKPSARAREIAKRNQTDSRVIELALREAKRVVRSQHVLITETQHGFVCANSGIDVSNVDGGVSAVLMPTDADKSAAQIHKDLKQQTGLHIPVIIADSFGRAWREGLCDVAIGAAGMRMSRDYRGERDPYGYRLRATEEAVADELAAMAGLVCGKDARIPACIIRGYTYPRGRGKARDLVRPAERDLFR